jgi:mono/diheme cytochrome c family protein
MQKKVYALRSARIWLSATVVLVISACRFYFSTTTDHMTLNPGPDAVQRGKNLTFLICAGCHYDGRVKRFIGRSLNDLPRIAGHLYSANLTQSKGFGEPPRYSDAELFYLLKTGISRSGKFMPYMMKPMMADEDISDIIAYLRSPDPAVSPYDTIMGRTKINFIGRAGIRHLMGPQPYQKGVRRPNEDDPIVYGRYLVGIIGCYHCHSQKASGLNFFDAERSSGYLQGGLMLKGPGGKKLRGPNLTPDKETGIGRWSLEEFARAVRDGVAPDDRKLSPPMDHFTALTDRQVEAIFAYLKQLPPAHHAVAHG